MNVVSHFSADPATALMSKSAGTTDWWRGAVIYQIYPRSFQDSNDDGIGDLRGITRRLPYIASLGVDAIWLSPFFKSPMLDFGYDVSDYTAVDPMFGTMADFDAMIAEAHRLGLKVMIDQVISHSSDQHAWFKKAEPAKTIQNPIGTFGQTQSRMVHRPTIGCPFLAARHGNGTHHVASISCIIF